MYRVVENYYYLEFTLSSARAGVRTNVGDISQASRNSHLRVILQTIAHVSTLNYFGNRTNGRASRRVRGTAKTNDERGLPAVLYNRSDAVDGIN